MNPDSSTWKTHDLPAAPKKKKRDEKSDLHVCPTCSRATEVRYRLTAEAVDDLRFVVECSGPERSFVDVLDEAEIRQNLKVLRRKTYATLRHWGLIESESENSGSWRPTAEAEQFLDGSTSLPLFVVTNHHREFVRFEGADVSVGNL